MDRWSLPGPAHFIRQAADALRDGQNLILATPTHTLDGLCGSLERFLHNEGWRVAGPITGDASDPVDQIFGVLGLNDAGAARRSVSLLRQRLEAGLVVLIRIAGPTNWNAWKRLLTEYEVASRDASPFDRPLLLVLTEGVPEAALPGRAAALKVLPWRDVLGELDVHLYVTDVLRQRSALDFRSKLLVRVIGRLALWDFTLADALLELTPSDLLRPTEAIRLASEALDYSSCLQPTWESGGLQRFDGVEMAHPFLFLTSPDQSSELKMRMWAAQAGEILPALELHRRALALRMRDMVSMPVTLSDVQIAHLDDLELGQLTYLAHTHNLSQSIRQTAEKWRRLRNKLAHLETLEADEALDPALLSVGGMSRGP